MKPMTNKTNWTLEKSKNTPLEIYERMERDRKRNENKWKIFAYISIAGFILSLAVMAWAINLPKTVPVLVSVSDFGEAKYIGEVNRINYSGIKVPEIAIEYQIRKFVTNKYTIPGDAEVLRNNLKDCYSCLTRDTSSKLSAELKEHNPLQDVQNLRKKVDIESVLKTSKNSYQIDFTITQSAPNTTNRHTIRMRGLVTLILLEPHEDDKILNPLGIYFSAYDFTEIK